MVRLARGVLLALLLCPRSALADYPTYAQVAASPAAYSSSNPLVFFIRYEGLKDTDAAFATLGRNSSTHVQVIEPGGGRLPMFVDLHGGNVRMLRELPTGTTYRASGRLRYFKKAQYDESSFKNMSLNVQKQSKRVDGYYKVSATGPEAAGHSVHYILDVSSMQKLSKSEAAKLGVGASDAPKAAAGYQAVDLAKLSKLSPPSPATESSGPGAPATPIAGIPVRLTLPYVGPMSGSDGAAGLAALAQSVAPPEETVVSETDADRSDPQLQLLKPPGPLAQLIVIAYGKESGVATALAGLRTGDSMVVTGVLKQAPSGLDAKLMLLLESVEKAAAEQAPGSSGPPRPPGPPGGGPPGGR